MSNQPPSFKILSDSFRDFRFCDSDGVNLEAWSHLEQVSLEGDLEVLVNLVEELYVDLLQRVARAKLVQLVMHLSRNYLNLV